MTAHGDRFRVGVVRGMDLSAVASASAIDVVVEAPHTKVFMTDCTLSFRKPVKTLRRTSALPSPSVSLRYQMLGVAAT